MLSVSVHEDAPNGHGLDRRMLWYSASSLGWLVHTPPSGTWRYFGKNPYISVRQWLGDSRGHWEGNTLVVETTNFSDQTSFEGATKNMRLIERWTRIADDRIDYRFTVSDPATWTRPWSAVITWHKAGTLYEYACHEDNYGLYGILAGARAQEKK